MNYSSGTKESKCRIRLVVRSNAGSGDGEAKRGGKEWEGRKRGGGLYLNPDPPAPSVTRECHRPAMVTRSRDLATAGIRRIFWNGPLVVVLSAVMCLSLLSLLKLICISLHFITITLELILATGIVIIAINKCSLLSNATVGSTFNKVL